VIGDNSILATSAILAGHVHIGDWVIMGGATASHQFCRIGDHSFVGGGAIVLADVPPFVMLGNDGKPRGINSEGLKRRGFSSHTIMQIKRGYKILYRNGNRASEAVEKLMELAGDDQDVKSLADFVANSSRGIAR
jgi:UDP-N-acetylglucosamine acyltransferase